MAWQDEPVRRALFLIELPSGMTYFKNALSLRRAIEDINNNAGFHTFGLDRRLTLDDIEITSTGGEEVDDITVRARVIA